MVGNGICFNQVNFGSLNTKGVEIAINAIPIQTHDFRWNIDANFSIWRTTIGKLPNNGADKNRTGGGIIFDPKLGKYVEVGGFAEGERFGSRFAYQLDGFMQQMKMQPTLLMMKEYLPVGWVKEMCR